MLDKHLHEMNDVEKQKTENIMQNTIQLLLQTYNGATERGIKALFLANGGGLVTMLTYFYGLPCPKQKLLLLPLKLFLFGFIAAILIVSVDYLTCFKNMLAYKSKITKFSANKITLKSMQNLYSYFSWSLLIFLILLGCASCIAFIWGCWLGVQNFFPC